MVLCIEMLLVYLLKLIEFDTTMITVIEHYGFHCTELLHICYVNWALRYTYSYMFRCALITSLCDSQILQCT